MIRHIWALWLVLAVLCLGCPASEVTPRTQVLLQIEAGSQIKARADRLVVYLARDEAGADVHDETFSLDADFLWPASLALVPTHDPAGGFRVEAVAFDGAKKLAVARVISQFLEGKTLLLVLELPDACLGELSCADDETCVPQKTKAVQCVSARVDPKQLKQLDTPPQPGESPLDASLDDDGGDELDADTSDASEVDAFVDDASSRQDAASPDAAQPDASVGDADAGADAESDASGDSGSVCSTNEDCLNGVDDDCDGRPDCEDSDCSPAHMCVPNAPGSLQLRVPGTQACPAGYVAARREVHRTLNGGGCSGCSCGAAGPTTCTAELLGYTTSANCTIGTPALMATMTSFTCAQNPVFSAQLQGVGVGAISATPGSCPAQGTAQPGTPRWGEDAALCAPSRLGAGCAAGMVCAPRPSAGQLCVQRDDATCPVGQTSERWYTGFDDTRACNACTCTASGASCAGVTVSYGNDWSCNGAHVLGASQKYCGSSYYPPAGLVGTPVNASCTPSAQLSGTLQARGDTNLCCLP